MSSAEKPNRSGKKSGSPKRSASATRSARARTQSRPMASSGTGVPPSPNQPPRSDAPAGTPSGKPPAGTEAVRTSPSDAGKPGADAPKAQPSLSFAQQRTPLDNNPAERGDAPDVSGDANLTSHLNDPAMRRVPPAGPAPESTGASHSGISPLARDGATPADEDARRARDLHDADQRGRLKGLAPRADVEGWHQAEEERQSDLPGKPRKL
ncbi:MAG TPA: hypothetical protein VH105_00490 [Burkholderiales bacterium]|jgi:hypothetical protein|nr:hypothetical protein [Burkholderiales bacterium]